MHIFLLETFYFIRKFFYLEQIVLFSLLFLKFMASHILDSNPAKLPLWNCKSQDSRTGYMSFWLCISWQFSYGILGLKRSDRSCRFIEKWHYHFYQYKMWKNLNSFTFFTGFWTGPKKFSNKFILDTGNKILAALWYFE